MSKERTRHGKPRSRRNTVAGKQRISHVPPVVPRYKQRGRLVKPVVKLKSPLEFDDLVPERGSDDTRS